MPEQPITKPIVDDAQEQLTTAPTLIELVQGLNTKPILQKDDYEYFAHREYDAEPVVRALRCRELGGYSWKGLYEVREVQHGSDPPDAHSGVGRPPLRHREARYSLGE